MAEQILVEYKVLVSGLKAEMKDVQASFKETEKAGVDAAKKTETAFVKVEEKTKSLKTQLKELKAQLATATDPKDIERLAKAAGKLTDQLEDASDAARVFASESKFEQMGTALGSVGSKLRNLDFKGAADQSKLLAGVISSFTFKDVISGAKDLGTAVINMGKSLLLNPLVLFIAAIVGLGFAIKDVIETEREQNKALDDSNERLKKVTESTNTLTQANRDAAIQLKIDAGLMSKTAGEKLIIANKYSEELKRIQKEENAEILQLQKELGVDKAKEDLQKAYKHAAEVPFQIAKLCHKILINSKTLTDNINNAVKSDFQIAVLLLKTGIKGASLNVDINLNDIEDKDFVEEKRKELNKILKYLDQID